MTNVEHESVHVPSLTVRSTGYDPGASKTVCLARIRVVARISNGMMPGCMSVYVPFATPGNDVTPTPRESGSPTRSGPFDRTEAHRLFVMVTCFNSLLELRLPETLRYIPVHMEHAPNINAVVALDVENEVRVPRQRKRTKLRQIKFVRVA